MSTHVAPLRNKLPAHSGTTEDDPFPLLDEEFDIFDLSLSGDISSDMLPADVSAEHDEFEAA